ncbi:ATP-binding protein [Sphingomonas sp. UV9]|uniref:AAA family ATPase n=1 Tax=Sphingomonas sp. UV9 TaxID=1851410 RepID=UPI000FFBEE3A|nr:ATP-binding protein [Sphingomonas sp. UV9]RXD04895.1 ATP-binding protein [Sphingomonas sp. UV9]
MATQAQLLALVRSFSERDDSRFQTVALQLAADAAQRGHRTLADQIRLMIHDARERSEKVVELRGGPIPVVRPKGELAGLVSAHYPLTRLENMVLEDDVLQRLLRIVEEQRHRAKLAQHGLKPRRKFLLTGPPGTGKTLTASAIAGELGLPLFTILLDGVITKYMGETSSKIRLVFEAMRTTRGVYFFDEVDALATKRLMGNDVGEARRTLNSILQMLDEDDGDALIIAATNHPELLDPAMFRRFDGAIEYGLLPIERIHEVFLKALMPFDLRSIDWLPVEQAANGMSQAEMIRSAEDAARAAVLNNDAVLTTSILVHAIKDRRGATRAK